MTMERSISPDALKTRFTAVHLIDVRRKADRDASTEVVPGATWHDPEQLTQWAGELPAGKPIVLYCVRGGSVSNSVVDALQARGLDARFIEGGIEGWKAAGGAVAAR
jgi:rhodanese-related sulfurtransferase